MKTLLLIFVLAGSMSAAIFPANAKKIQNTVVCTTTPTDTYALTYNAGTGMACWTAPGEASMVYPGAGFGVSTGSAWGTSRTIAAGTGIGVTNGNGVSGNPTIAAAVIGQNNAGSAVGSGYHTFRFQNGTGTTWTLTDLGSGILGAAPNVDTTSLVTLSGTQTMTGKTFGDQVLQTCIAAPSTPSAGLGASYCDSTSKNWAIKDDAGVVKHGVQTTTATSNQFLTAVTAAGVFAKAQPAFSDLSGTATAAQLPAGARIRGPYVGFPNPTAGDVEYTAPVQYGCTIIRWDIVVVGGTSPTATLDIWKVSGSSLPTVANTITASAKPAISSGSVAGSSTLTGWTTSVSVGDLFAVKVDAVTGSPTKLILDTTCQL